MHEPYLYLDGLRSLAKGLRGDERIHVGIRPYGFHAGNAMSLLVYPYLLCKEVRRLGKEPSFKFFISINDYEQDELDGPDCRQYPFNIYPKNTSLQHSPDDDECSSSIVEHWQPIIERIVNSLKKTYPNISIQYVRNSSLKRKAPFRKLLLDTLKNPRRQAEIFKKYSGKEVLDDPVQYGGIVCPSCKKSHGTTTVISAKRIRWKCRTCACEMENPYEFYDYWWYHKAMLTARLRILRIEVAMSGADHFSEGDYNVRRHFLKEYFKDYPEPKMLFCPVLVALDGQKMSKSRKNTEFVKIENLIRLAEDTLEGSILMPFNAIAPVKDGKEYASLF